MIDVPTKLVKAGEVWVVASWDNGREQGLMLQEYLFGSKHEARKTMRSMLEMRRLPKEIVSQINDPKGR